MKTETTEIEALPPLSWQEITTLRTEKRMEQLFNQLRHGAVINIGTIQNEARL